MSIERVKAYFASFGLEERVLEFDVSSATVELAARALGCEPCRIAKSMSFLVEDKPILVVMAGDARVSNPKFKERFQAKAKMIPPELVEGYIGHAVGGVCPFAVKEGVAVYLDESLRRFRSVFPAAGSSNSAIELTLEELEKYARARGWVDVSKDWEGEA